MGKIEDIKNIFEELNQELKNPLHKKDLEEKVSKDFFKYDDFHNVVKEYINSLNILNGATENLLDKIILHANTCLYVIRHDLTVNSIKKLISSAIVLQEYVPSEFPENYIDNALTITRGEFAQRYDRLVNSLNPLNQESNLVLETKTKTPFKLFRNSNNSIAVKAGQEKTPLSFTLDKLMGIVYDGEEAKYHKSYSDVIIEKILDNSIFDSIKLDNKKATGSFNFDHMPEGRIKKLEEQLEDERLKNVGKIKELEDKINDQIETQALLNHLIQKGENAENDFRNAQASIEKELRLQKSYKFWDIKEKRYFRQYLRYLGLAVIMSGVLLYNLFQFLQSNPITLDIQNSQTVVNVKSSDKNISKNASVQSSDQNISKNASLNADIKSVKIWEYGFLIFATTLVIWLIKIFVKIALSNYHLSVDAGGRVIMIRTYLALLKEGKGFEAEDKKVMLDNIFRPTNIGVIQDETSVTITDVISSLKK